MFTVAQHKLAFLVEDCVLPSSKLQLLMCNNWQWVGLQSAVLNIDGLRWLF